jgi:hypothetical protein
MKLKKGIHLKQAANRVITSVLASTLSYRLKGGALYIAVLVSCIIGVTLSLFMWLSMHNQRTVIQFTQDTQLHYNLKSAFEMAQSAYFTEERNNAWIKNQINDDSIKVKKIFWGAYQIICAETKNRHHSISQSGLFGTYLSADTGILVSNNSRPVGLSGLVSFKSNCYLPHAGVKPAYIEGQSYVSSPGNAAFIKHSSLHIPQINPDILKLLKNEKNTGNLFVDSLVSTIPDIHNQPFRHKTVVYHVQSTHLSKLNLSNNIKLFCNEVEIDSSCHFENILIICDKIRFKSGFKGKVHVIARDSIRMDPDCEFLFPSSFVLLPEESGEKSIADIQFNKACKFFGGVIAINEKKSSGNNGKVFIRLCSGAEINGIVYSSDYVHIEGLLNASIIANQLLLKTPSAVYENHILSCEVNPKKHAGLISVPLLFNQQSKLICCTPLY